MIMLVKWSHTSLHNLCTAVWSKEGCIVVSSDGDHVECDCTSNKHGGHFGLLFVSLL